MAEKYSIVKVVKDGRLTRRSVVVQSDDLTFIEKMLKEHQSKASENETFYSARVV